MPFFNYNAMLTGGVIFTAFLVGLLVVAAAVVSRTRGVRGNLLLQVASTSASAYVAVLIIVFNLAPAKPPAVGVSAAIAICAGMGLLTIVSKLSCIGAIALFLRSSVLAVMFGATIVIVSTPGMDALPRLLYVLLAEALIGACLLCLMCIGQLLILAVVDWIVSTFGLGISFSVLLYSLIYAGSVERDVFDATKTGLRVSLFIGLCLSILLYFVLPKATKEPRYEVVDNE